MAGHQWEGVHSQARPPHKIKHNGEELPCKQRSLDERSVDCSGVVRSRLWKLNGERTDA